jgi:hypothetical protein
VQKYTKDRTTRKYSAIRWRLREKRWSRPSVDPTGIELIVGLIRKTVPQAAAAKAGDFYDPRFFSELRDSGFLKRLKREKS